MNWASEEELEKKYAQLSPKQLVALLIRRETIERRTREADNLVSF